MQITIGTSRKTYTTRLFVYSLALIFTQKFAPLRFPLCRALYDVDRLISTRRSETLVFDT